MIEAKNTEKTSAALELIGSKKTKRITRIIISIWSVNYYLLSFFERGFSSELIPSKKINPKMRENEINRQKLIIDKVACRICIPLQQTSVGYKTSFPFEQLIAEN